MQILSNFNQLNFTAKNKDVRKADDIQRNVRHTFPMMSNSYVDNFYKCTEDTSKNSSRAKQIADNIWNDISKSRKKQIEHFYCFPNKVSYYLNCLSSMANSKKGNCAEYSLAALMGLYANGYYNSKIANLYYSTAFMNKHTGKIEYLKNDNSLDHSIVLTDMNNSKSTDIVLDPWLGFAAKKQEASAKYKQTFHKDCEIYDSLCKELFKISKLKNGENFNPQDYYQLNSIVYKPHSNDSIESINSIKQLIECGYSELILENKK